MNTNDLFYTCGLIEYIGRKTKNKRADVVTALGKDTVSRIYRYADVFHSDLIEKVADEYIEFLNIPDGDFDNVAKCRYLIPDHWTIGKVYQRLIADTLTDDDLISHVIKVYQSWVSDGISDYNSDFYYQPRSYIALCYKENKLIE